MSKMDDIELAIRLNSASSEAEFHEDLKKPMIGDRLKERQQAIRNRHPESALDSQVGGDHYMEMPIQPVTFCERNGLSACESAVVKYVCRHRRKNGRQDLEKAIHYLQILIEENYPE